MKKLLIPLVAVLALSGCATSSMMREKLTNNQFNDQIIEILQRD